MWKIQITEQTVSKRREKPRLPPVRIYATTKYANTTATISELHAHLLPQVLVLVSLPNIENPIPTNQSGQKKKPKKNNFF
ncbi:11199_t:CDS:2, partial [Acaulospora morrowiae]